MKLDSVRKSAVLLCAAGVIAAVLLSSSSVSVHAVAQDSDENLAAIGLQIAPPFINMNGKDPTLVGLGSYIINGETDCNGCHGSSPANEFLPANNPYHRPPNNSPMQFNPATYLAGGRSFGAAGPGTVSDPKSPLYAGPGLGPIIIARNLTPDYTGNPAGGMDLYTFMSIIRTGHDFDSRHPNCGLNSVFLLGDVTYTDNCYSAPVDGSLLQVMPWAKFRNMTDYQLTAIWTYLSTVPCNAHNDTAGDTYPWLKNQCTQ
ncbi:MAG TPA: hypothetical protein VKX45_16385 [Bryobacteraceae bacterium]|jgi:hypothetical protein|nr:hypothetical protein [Bryobacteraceae bacterium]